VSHETTDTISYIGPLGSDETCTVVTRVVLPNQDGLWQHGLFVIATIAIGDTVVPLLMPKTALQTLDGKPNVCRPRRVLRHAL